MRFLGWGHVPEATLAELADGVSVVAQLTPPERLHLEACDRCQALLEGHRRAGKLLTSTWQFIDLSLLAAAARLAPVRSRVGMAGAAAPAMVGRPSLGVVFVLALLAVLLGGALAVGTGVLRLPALVTVPASPPAEESPRPSSPRIPASPDRCDPGAGSATGWPAPATLPGPAAQVGHGVIAGWSISNQRQHVMLLDARTGAMSQVTQIPIEQSNYEGGVVGWSPDGQALGVGWAQPRCPSPSAWTGDLYVATEGILTRATPERMNPVIWSWSPDSSWLAAVREALEPAIWLIPRDGGAPRDLGAPCERCRPDGAHWHPDQPGGLVWSPDGSLIAATYHVTDGDPGTDTEEVVETGVAFFELAGQEWRRVSFAGASIDVVGWLDDDDLVVNVAVGNAEGTGELHRVSADSPDAVVALGIEAHWGTAGLVSIAPDRSRLAVVQPHERDVAVVDLATGAITSVYPGAAGGPMTGWSPDSRALAIVTTVGPANGGDSGRTELSVFELETGERRLLSEVSSDMDMTWSPDSSRLAVSGGLGSGVWFVSRDGSEVRRVSDTRLWGMSWQPVWP